MRTMRTQRRDLFVYTGSTKRSYILQKPERFDEAYKLQSEVIAYSERTDNTERGVGERING